LTNASITLFQRRFFSRTLLSSVFEVQLEDRQSTLIVQLL
jgi:hypothetical protein